VADPGRIKKGNRHQQYCVNYIWYSDSVNFKIVHLAKYVYIY